MIISPAARRLLCALGLLVLAGYCLLELTQLYPAVVGLDFLPLRHAAIDLLAGRSVYTDHAFVYPPAAAVLLIPLAWGGEQAAATAWLTLNLVALGVAAGLIVAGSRIRLLAAGAAALLFFGSCVASDSLWLGNMSVALVPLAVLAVLAFDRHRWLLGSGIVVASLLLKPLLLPLLLVPMVRGQWRPVARSVAAGLALLLLSVATVPGAGSLPTVVRYCLAATNLHGTNAVNNLSVRGWVEAHHAPAVLALVGAVSVLLPAGAVVAARRHRLSCARLGALLLDTTLLAGSISEVHYLLLLGALCLLVLTRDADRRQTALLAPGLIMLLTPAQLRGLLFPPGATQTWYVAAELLVLGGLCLAAPLRVTASVPVTSGRRTPAGRASVRPQPVPERVGSR